MFAKLTNFILKRVIASKIQKAIKDQKIPQVDVGKIKIIVPIEIKELPVNVDLGALQNLANGIINNKVEPKIKYIFDIEVEVKAV